MVPNWDWRRWESGPFSGGEKKIYFPFVSRNHIAESLGVAVVFERLLVLSVGRQVGYSCHINSVRHGFWKGIWGKQKNKGEWKENAGSWEVVWRCQICGQVSYDSSAQQSLMTGPPGNTGSQLSAVLRWLMEKGAVGPITGLSDVQKCDVCLWLFWCFNLCCLISSDKMP